MKRRCYNPRAVYFEDYGKRGIRVCNDWHEYEPFRLWAITNGYRPGLVIDRADNDGDYSPNNCQWVTHQVSALNRRNNVLLTAWGESKPVAAWATDKRCVVTEGTLRKRLKLGWDPETAISCPSNSRPRGPRPRAAYCINGHPLSGDNLKVDGQGYSVCIECSRDRNRRYKARQKKETFATTSPPSSAPSSSSATSAKM